MICMPAVCFPTQCSLPSSFSSRLVCHQRKRQCPCIVSLYDNCDYCYTLCGFRRRLELWRIQYLDLSHTTSLQPSHHGPSSFDPPICTQTTRPARNTRLTIRSYTSSSSSSSSSFIYSSTSVGPAHCRSQRRPLLATSSQHRRTTAQCRSASDLWAIKPGELCGPVFRGAA